MNTLEMLFKKAADALWGDWMLVALLGVGIFYTLITGFV